MNGWQGQGRSHKGRRPANEDALVCRDGAGLWAVIDGMGGHAAGDLAASMVRQSLENLTLGGGMGHRLLAVETALQTANHAIRHHSALHLGSNTMGATVVVMLIHQDEAVVLWAGDSRLYRYEEGLLELLTRDHTPLQALVDAGELSETEAMAHPKAHMIHRAIGSNDSLELDQSRFPVSAGQQFLLTSDGIHSVLDQGALQRLMAENCDVTSLLKAALDAGSRDNVTAVKISSAF